MKTTALLLATLFISIASSHAKFKNFTVRYVIINSYTGKMPTGAPIFKKNQTIKLDVTQKKLIGPKDINLPVVNWNVGFYRKYWNTTKENNAKVWKTAPDSQPYQVDLTFIRPVKVFGGYKVAGAVTYVLNPQ